MSPDPSENASSASEQLRSRIQVLRDAVEAQERTAARKRQIYIVLGAGLALICVVWFSILTSMAFKIDAHAITEYGRHEVERQLPGGRENLKLQLEAAAPNLVAQLVREMTDAVPHLRPLILESLDYKLMALTAEFEAQLLRQMETVIRENRAKLEQAFPGESEVQQVSRLMKIVAARFNENVALALDGLYPQYAEQIDRVRVHLERLSRTPESQLTPKERTHKELIETVLRITLHEQTGGGQGF
ncbi:MAG TPA: hypothetical protein VMT52_05455 [Planctomycetota bacterium]|nr:hypothetical protein [Planctomycetota bacterium]